MTFPFWTFSNCLTSVSWTWLKNQEYSPCPRENRVFNSLFSAILKNENIGYPYRDFQKSPLKKQKFQKSDSLWVEPNLKIKNAHPTFARTGFSIFFSQQFHKMSMKYSLVGLHILTILQNLIRKRWELSIDLVLHNPKRFSMLFLENVFI